MKLEILILLLVTVSTFTLTGCERREGENEYICIDGSITLEDISYSCTSTISNFSKPFSVDNFSEIKESYLATEYYLDGYQVYLKNYDLFCELWGTTFVEGNNVYFLYHNTCDQLNGTPILNIDNHEVSISHYVTYWYEYSSEDEEILEIIGIEIVGAK
jgi:hypothetical protein